MKINFSAPICGTSYGYCGRHFLKELYQLGHDVALFPIGQISCEDQAEANFIKQRREAQQEFSRCSPSVRLYHQFDLAHHTGEPRIGFPIFELDRFTAYEKAHMESNDLILVCSEWARNIILDQTSLQPGEVKVVPLGVDRSIFFESRQPKSTNLFREFAETFIVLNTAKWECRKGADVIAQIFNTAFRKGDDVELWMMPHNPFLTPEERAVFEYMVLSPANNKLYRRTRILPRLLTQGDVADIMVQANAGLFPSRAEGWNLPALEMMACGKDVILTNYSAHTEFAGKNNSHLIEIDELEVAHDGKWFFSNVHGGHWAKIGERQIKQAAEHLRYLYENRHDDSKRLAALETAKQFSWSAAAQKLVDCI